MVYVTSMGVVRDTYQRCHKVKQILRTLLVKFDERDCYMNREVQDEIRDRLPQNCSPPKKKSGAETATEEWEAKKIGLLPSSSYYGVPGQPAKPHINSYTKYISLPQVFIEGQWLGVSENKAFFY